MSKKLVSLALLLLLATTVAACQQGTGDGGEESPSPAEESPTEEPAE